MSFPSTQLTLLVELALNADLTAAPGTWSWTDVTAYVYTRDPVRITRGRPDETSIAQPQKLTLTVNNRDGRWSTRNPSGAWYGQLRKGTPIRVSAEGHVRYAGFISSLPPRWDVSGNDRYAPLEAQGLLYRLAQGTSPIRSAIKRTTLAVNGTTPSAYWPLEDGGGTAVGAAGSAGVLTPSGLVGFGATAFGPAGSAASLDLSGGGMLTGRTGLPVAAVASWEVTAVMGWNTAFPSGSPTSNQYMTAQFLTGTADTGANPAFGFAVVNGGIAGDMTRWQVAGANLDAPSVGNSWHFRFDTTESMVLGSTYHVRMVLAQSGGNVSFNLYVNGTLRVTNAFVGTLYQPVAVNVNGPASDTAIYTVTPTNPDSLSHLTIYVPARGSDAIYAAKDGYAGELAHVRFSRLLNEDGITNTAGATTSQAMGSQSIKALLDLLRDCEATDQGFLYEGTDFGLTFQSHTQRENQESLAAGLALTYTTKGHVAPPLEPTDDDQGTINDAEVIRDGGSSSRLDSNSAPTVAYSELSIANIGRRDDSQTYSLALDTQTYDLAGWRLHMGTYPGYRFPVVTLNLAAAPSLITSYTAADLAFLLTIASPPTDIGPDKIAVIVEGYAESFGPFDWDVAANCSLAGPWRVGQLASTTGDTSDPLGWLDYDSCILHSSESPTDTSWLVDCYPNNSTASDDYPRDHFANGERVTAASSITVADVFNRTTANGWGSCSSGSLPWTTNGGSASDYSTNAATGLQSNGSVNVFRSCILDAGGVDFDITVQCSLPIASASAANATTRVWGRYTDANNYYEADLELTTGGSLNLILAKRVATVRTVLVTVTGVGSGHAANDLWTIRFQGQGTGLRVRAWKSSGADPGYWQIDTTDSALTTGSKMALATRLESGNTDVLPVAATWDNLTLTSCYVWTVTRSVNGVSKSHSPGESISLVQPFVLAL